MDKLVHVLLVGGLTLVNLMFGSAGIGPPQGDLQVVVLACFLFVVRRGNFLPLPGRVLLALDQVLCFDHYFAFAVDTVLGEKVTG